MNEPYELILTAEGELLEFSPMCFCRVIPGNDLKMVSDFGNVFDKQEVKYTFFSAIAEFQSVGLLINGIELNRGRVICEYEIPLTSVVIRLRILEILPDFTGWARLVCEIVYD